MTGPVQRNAAPTPFPVERSKTTPHGLRIDIQLLRALAIVLVLLHHAHVPFVPGGFLGVDIFFVVSGYLMTGIIARELEEGRFRFAGFYARRARRLLPAAYATLAVTAALALLLLDYWTYQDFLAQLVGSCTFVVNIVLWQQSDYFNTGAALKPLLHMWSLAVEEQYYIVLPLLLFLCPRRMRLALAVGLTLVSAAACIWLGQRSPSANFYFLPTRLWELGIGSILALLVRRDIVRPLAIPGVRLVAVVILIATPLIVNERGHPGLPALVVCLATAVLLIPGYELRPSSLLKPFVFIGDRSYSLYLVHWPIYAFANNVFIEAVPGWVNAALIVPVLVWMELQYRLVEQRFRTMRLTPPRIVALIAIPVVVIGASFAYQRSQPLLDPALIIGNNGVGPTCNARSNYQPTAACKTAARPRTMLWGDSFAMHLGTGLTASTPGGIEQATRHSCGPLVGLAPVNGAQQTLDWARRCLDFNNSVLASLDRSPQIDTVILSSIFAQYVPGQEAGWHVAVRRDGRVMEQPQSLDLLEAALDRTVRAIRAMGKRVVLIAPPPGSGFDTARCFWRTSEGKPTIAPDGRCDYSRATYRAVRQPTIAFLNDIERRDIVPVLWFDRALCASGMCRITVGDTPIYRDLAHLSVSGSRALGREMMLGQRARAMAK